MFFGENLLWHVPYACALSLLPGTHGHLLRRFLRHGYWHGMYTWALLMVPLGYRSTDRERVDKHVYSTTKEWNYQSLIAQLLSFLSLLFEELG